MSTVNPPHGEISPPVMEEQGTLDEISANVKKWTRDFKKDFVKKEYAPLKLLFFLIYGANFCLLPFLTLQARSLGITEEEVGIIYAFMPIAALIAPPIAGMIADHIGNFKIFVSAVTALAGLASLLLLTVPVGRIIHPLPPNVPLQISCSPLGGNLNIQDDVVCEYITEKDFSITLDRCSLNCSEVGYTALGPNNLNCGDTSSVCLKNPTDSSLSHPYPIANIDEETIYEWPTSLILQSELTNNASVSFKADHLCPHSFQAGNGATNTESQACLLVCEGHGTRKEFCRNTKVIEEINPNTAFYAHLAVRLTMEFSLATSMPLLEGAAATVLKEHGGDFGFQRLYANLGMVALTPLSGILIDYSSNLRGFEDFSPAMYLYCALKLFSAFIMLFLNLKFKQASKKVLKEFWSILRNIQIIVFLTSALISGICYGFLENFLFWLLQDLGADKKLMGMTITVGSFFGIPVLLVSTFIIKKLGHVNTLVMGFCVYILRFFGYTIISNPWLAMPFEALECITTSLMLVAFVSYAAIVATPSTVVTLQGVFGGLHFGVGRAFGSLLGGFLIELTGISTTFRIMGAIGGTTGVIYGLINFFFFRKIDAIKASQAPKESSSIQPKESQKQTDLETNGKEVNGVANGLGANAKHSEETNLGQVNKGYKADT